MSKRSLKDIESYKKYSLKHNFSHLATLYPWFSEYVIYKKKYPTINWKDPNSLIALTKVILKHDFSIDFSMPIEHLCPPVPRSFNYLSWIDTLLSYSESQTNSNINGIDIGTGSSCIFPLIGAKYFNWNFLATDICNDSIYSANKNIKDNNLEDKIFVKRVNKNQILKEVIKENDKYDFCMCNPPFYSDIEEKTNNPNRICNITHEELCCKEGEIGFVEQIINESLILKHNIRWFTSMIGKKKNFKCLLSKVNHIKPNCIQYTELVQGNQTRWCIGWTFQNVNENKLYKKIKRNNKFQNEVLLFLNEISKSKFDLDNIKTYLYAYDNIPSNFKRENQTIFSSYNFDKFFFEFKIQLFSYNSKNTISIKYLKGDKNEFTKFSDYLKICISE